MFTLGEKTGGSPVNFMNYKPNTNKPNFISHKRQGFRQGPRQSANGMGQKYSGSTTPRAFKSYNSTNTPQQRFQNRRPRKFIKEFNDPSVFVKKVQPVAIIEEQIEHTSFDEFAFPNVLKDNIKSKGYTKPTPIQDKSIEAMLEGHDLIGIANTGTGKTAAFLLPIITTLYKDRQKKAIVIAPTRELAAQIHAEFRSFTKDIKLFSSLVIGGANMHRQIYEVRRGVHLVVGTPGRIKDLIEQKALFLEDYEIVVLDEVDLMVDIGFIQDVKYFISLMPQERQSLFFSATITPKVSQILEQFVRNPITVSVKKQETSQNIDQDVVRVNDPSKKLDQLHDLLIKEEFKKVLVFGRTKWGVEKLHKDLTTRGFRVGAIHGNKSQGHRARVLDSFKRDQIQILLATDVAARGLDIPHVSHVINYELPESYEDYIHRIGRTGRASQTGVALTFIEN